MRLKNSKYKEGNEDAEFENVKTDVNQIRKRFDQFELKESAALLNELILEEQKALPNQDASRIFIGGFS